MLYIICKPNYACKKLCKTYRSLNLTTLVNNCLKLVFTFINQTCTKELKINVSWNNTPLDYGVRVIYPCVVNKTD